MGASRVEMTLKDSQGGSWTDMGDLKKGDVVKGRIKRLEPFGAFVELHNSTLTGLAHISEVSDDFVKTLGVAFQVGQGKGSNPQHESMNPEQPPPSQLHPNSALLHPQAC